MNLYGVNGERLLTEENYIHRGKLVVLSLFRPQDKREIQQAELNAVRLQYSYITCVKFKTNLLRNTFVS